MPTEPSSPVRRAATARRVLAAVLFVCAPLAAPALAKDPAPGPMFETTKPPAEVRSSLGTGRLLFDFVRNDSGATRLRVSIVLNGDLEDTNSHVYTPGQTHALASLLAGMADPVMNGLFEARVKSQIDAYERGAFGNLGFRFEALNGRLAIIERHGEETMPSAVILAPDQVFAASTDLEGLLTAHSPSRPR